MRRSRHAMILALALCYLVAGTRLAEADTAHVAVIPLVMNVGPSWDYPVVDFGALPVESAPTDRPAEEHADLNLALRSYDETSAYVGLVQYNGDTDYQAPDLRGLFGSFGVPAFVDVFRVHDWNWTTNSQGSLVTYPDVTVLGLASEPGESVYVPASGYYINGQMGYQALVLYASESRITLKYTGEDNVVSGYTLHIENLSVHPDLLSLYNTCNSDGRATLPALRAGQCIGVAGGEELDIAIRDCGCFMDPRSAKDWWQ